MTHNISKLNEEIIITDFLVEKTLNQLRSKQNYAPSSLTAEIADLSPESLKPFVDTVIASLTKEKEALPLLEKFSELLSLANLEEATRLQFCELVSAVDTASRMKKSAELYFDTTKNKPLLSAAHIKLNHAKDNFFSILEGFLEIFGLSNLFDTSETPEKRAKKMVLLFGLISSITAILIPLVGVSHGFLVMGIVTVALLSFSLIYPSIRPMPHSLPDMENWTEKYLEGNLETPKQTPDSLDLLADTLQANKQPLLIGPSGIGKSELAKSLVKAIEEGKYPALKGKQVFYVNTGKLTKESLSNISQMMGRHRENIILILDNIHQGFSKDKGIGPKLEEMLENGDHFPHVIGITTEESYRNKIASESTFSSHFCLVPVRNPSESVTENAVQYAASRLPPRLIDPNALSTLPQKAKQAFGPSAPMPKTALDILSECVHRTSPAQYSSLDKRMERIRERFQISAAELATGNALTMLPYQKTDETELLKGELAALERQKEVENEQRAQFFALREKLPRIKEKILKLSTQLSEQSSDREKKLFLLLSHYFAFAFEEMLREEAARLELQTELNQDLVDSVIETERMRRAVELL